MKTFFPHLLTITTLIGLAGCGSKSVGKLEVSQSFATTNTSFGGGLVISGTHLSSGKTFSKSILSGKEMRIYLKTGAWKISAVGWDGASAKKIFAGIPYCGTVTANLENSSTVVDLTINQTNCNSADFTAGHTNGGSLREFGAVITCNTFFNPLININSSIASQIIAPGIDTDEFCESPNLDSDLKSDVKAVKIYTNNKLPSQLVPELGFDSGCMQGLPASKSIIFPRNALNPYNGSTLKLPFNNLPLTFVTFKDTSCSKPIATFHFKDGLAAGSPHFDHLLQTRGSMEMKLLLPANDLRKAKSALIGLLPSIKRYNSGTPLKFATTSSNLTTLNTFFPAIINTYHKVIVDEFDCGTIGSTGPITYLTCSDIGDKIELNYKGGSTAGPATITISDGTIFRRTFSLHVVPEDGIFRSLQLNSQARMIEMLGQNVDDDSIFFGQEDDEKHFGVLSQARHMFGPNGAGGALGIADESRTFLQACNELLMDKTETVFKEKKMAFESYRVNIHDGVVSAPTNFMCRTDNLSPSDCSQATGGIIYDKRMNIFDHKISFVAPIIVMEFSCSELAGRFEMNMIEVRDISKLTNKKIVSWNTNPDLNLSLQRLELLKITARDRYNGTHWERITERRNMARIQKISDNNLSAFNYNFETTYDAALSTYRQKAQAIFLQTLTEGAELAFRHSSSSTTDQTKPYLVLNGLTGLPPIDTIADKFSMNDSYPQTRGLSDVGMTLLPKSNNADRLDGHLIFNLQALGTNNFTDSFGSSFFSVP